MLIFQAKEYVETFLNHCTRPFGNLMQLCGHNRARQRDKLAHLLEDFATLQDEVGVYKLLYIIFIVLSACKLSVLCNYTERKINENEFCQNWCS